MEYLFVVTAIIGFIEFIKALNNHDWQDAEIIFGAVLIGAICGYFKIDNLDILSGIQTGLAASGTYKGVSLIGGKQPVEVLPTVPAS